MSLQALVESYGYLAVIIGTFLEGETVLIMGSIAAQLGYLELPWVVASALAGTLIGDQFCFFFGRYKGKEMLHNRPRWEVRTNKIFDLLQRNETLLILGFRFMYGIRTLALFVVGMSRVATAKFIILNVLGALFWAGTISGFGYAFGKAFQVAVGDIKQYQIQVIGIIVIVGTLTWLIHNYNRRKRGMAVSTSETPNKE